MVDDSAIGNLIASCASPLPESYITFLRQCGPIEAEMSIPPYWIQLWSASDVLQANLSYRVDEFMPGWFAFGSSGGGEMFAFDTRRAHPWEVFMVPFVPLSESAAMLIARDFMSFIKAITVSG